MPSRFSPGWHFFFDITSPIGGIPLKLPLSRRLLACCRFVNPGDRVADVGCDHGYLGIHLLQTGVASYIIASDINQGPLDSAVRNAAKYGVEDKMSFHLSDGVRNIPRHFDTLVCAGMGADTMVSILEAAPWLKDRQYRLILQCQSKTHLLRRYLSEQGWMITEEAVLRDGRFLYTIMEVVWEPGHPALTPGEWYFPPAMLSNPSKETIEHFRWLKKELTKIVSSRGDAAEEAQKLALAHLLALEQNPNLAFLKEETH